MFRRPLVAVFTLALWLAHGEWFITNGWSYQLYQLSDFREQSFLLNQHASIPGRAGQTLKLRDISNIKTLQQLTLFPAPSSVLSCYDIFHCSYRFEAGISLYEKKNQPRLARHAALFTTFRSPVVCVFSYFFPATIQFLLVYVCVNGILSRYNIIIHMMLRVSYSPLCLACALPPPCSHPNTDYPCLKKLTICPPF